MVIRCQLWSYLCLCYNSLIDLTFSCIYTYIDVAVDLIGGILTAESLQYDFSTIEAATDYFSMENKIGVGGFGDVYKVKLLKI